jgi:hypothetical protein
MKDQKVIEGPRGNFVGILEQRHMALRHGEVIRPLEAL